MTVQFTLRINDEDHTIGDAWVGESLLFVLRERLGLTATKDACGAGQCGACTVLVDGEPRCSCVLLAASAVGREITTLEGLDGDDNVGDVQRAFVEAGAVQCGFCTPGLIVQVHAFLERCPAPTDLDVREALVGNLCRCTGYGRIVAAVHDAAERRRRRTP